MRISPTSAVESWAPTSSSWRGETKLVASERHVGTKFVCKKRYEDPSLSVGRGAHSPVRPGGSSHDSHPRKQPHRVSAHLNPAADDERLSAAPQPHITPTSADAVRALARTRRAESAGFDALSSSDRMTPMCAFPDIDPPYYPSQRPPFLWLVSLYCVDLSLWTVPPKSARKAFLAFFASNICTGRPLHIAAFKCKKVK